jgi:general secretion pathway protein M
MSPAAHRLTAVLLLLLLLAAAYNVFNHFWLGHYQRYQQAQVELQDRLQRYERLLASRDELHRQLEFIRSQQANQDYYLPRTTPTLAATELQQQVSQLVQNYGGSLASSQILPAREQNGVVRVALRVQLSGDAETLQRTLYDLESAEPFLFVDNLQVRSRSIRERIRGAGAEDQGIRTTIQLIMQGEISGYMVSG